MPLNPDDLINREAGKGLKDLLDRVNALMANDYFRIMYADQDVSNPPTGAELVAIFGNPGTFNGIAAGLLNDSKNLRYWFCVTDDISRWYTVQLTLAI